MMNSVVEGPLAGINVLAVSQYIAGPFAGQQLADGGANVIKVERPDWGDPMRNFASDKAPLYGANFLAFNRNKRSIELNLQTPEGVETFRALAARADVVLENFRPDVMDRLGIGRSEEHTSELQSLMRISYAVFCLKKKKNKRSDTKYI